jgi:oxygen-independent coproporphyrinogen-3 oxidase
MQVQGLQRLADAGFGRYEVSAYAREGRRARHNLNYWRFGDYLGIGAGAHAKLSGAGGARRRARHKHPKTYMETAGSAAMIQEDRLVASDELVFEFCMNALRLDEGFSWPDFETRTGLERGVLEKALADPASKGLLRFTDTGAVPTPLGLQHLNTLLTRLL